MTERAAGEFVLLARQLPERWCNEWALVLAAVGIAHEVRPGAGGHELWVAAAEQARAVGELSRYLRENHARPPAPLSWPRHRHAWVGIAAYIAVLVSVSAAALYRVGEHNWLRRGVLDAGFLERGEWWRMLTALTLHADAGHLVANLIFGAVFAYPAAQLMGAGVAWLAIVAGAALAYALDAALQAPSHSVVGASTAVFVALGLTSAFTWRRRASLAVTTMQRAAPLVAGIALLGFTGAGGERTDVLAHLLGFAAGLGGGFLAERLPLPPPSRPRVQWWPGLAALALIVLAWWAALRG